MTVRSSLPHKRDLADCQTTPKIRSPLTGQLGIWMILEMLILEFRHRCRDDGQDPPQEPRPRNRSRSLQLMAFVGLAEDGPQVARPNIPVWWLSLVGTFGFCAWIISDSRIGASSSSPTVIMPNMPHFTWNTRGKVNLQRIGTPAFNSPWSCPM